MPSESNVTAELWVTVGSAALCEETRVAVTVMPELIVTGLSKESKSRTLGALPVKTEPVFLVVGSSMISILEATPEVTTKG
jgi:hypothetical protein